MRLKNKKTAEKAEQFCMTESNQKPVQSGTSTLRGSTYQGRGNSGRNPNAHRPNSGPGGVGQPSRGNRPFKRGGKSKRPNTSKTKPWLSEPKGVPLVSATPADPSTLRIIPLGGCDGVGRNMTMLEYGGDIIIIDMGLQFPDEDMPGIDYIIPNIAYLRPRTQNIRAVIFTHGHLDHIGAVPHLLADLGNPPLVATPLTMALIKRRLDDHKFPIKRLKGHQVRSVDEKLTLGKFQVEFFATSHTIMDSLGIIVKTPNGTVVHPGDWKFEDSPKLKHPAEYDRLAERLKGQRSIMLLDSTGATKQGHQMAESEIIGTLERLLGQAKGRVIMATFSSMLERINIVLNIAEKLGKRVAFDGFSMKANVAIAKQLGYLKFKPSTIIDVAQVDDYPLNKVIIMCTGAQGEERASLMRITNGDHRFLKLLKTDTVIFSSSVIPGNERTVQHLKDALYRQASDVYHNELMDVHAGGHAMAGDIALMLQLVKPTYVVPTHGNYYMLRENGKTAMRLGWSPDHVLVPDDGQVISFNRDGGKLTEERVPADHVFVDGLGVGDVSHVVLRDRQALASDGMILVVAAVQGSTGKLIGKPEIITRGLVQPTTTESRSLIEQARQLLRQLLQGASRGKGANVNYIKDQIRNELGQFIVTKIDRRPMILPVIIEV